MGNTEEFEGRCCPRCGSRDKQSKFGFTVAESQRYACGSCKYKYTLNPKPRIYSEEVQILAMRAYYSGISGRGVGKMFGMNKANIYRWIKKPNEAWISRRTDFSDFELDELYTFIERKSRTEEGENTYICTMIS